MFKKIKKTFADMDKILLFTTLILIIFGTLNIVTASSREAVVNRNANVFYYFFRHSAWLSIGLIAFLVLISKVETKYYKFLMPFLYTLVLILNLILVLKGVSTRGAQNWFSLGFIKIQPSELAKPMLILTLSLLFEKFHNKITQSNESHVNIIWFIIGVSVILPVLVFLQKDLGTAIILFGIFAIIFYASYISINEKIKYTLAIGIVIIGVVLIKYSDGGILSNAQLSRFDFFNPCSKYESTGYQVCNAYIAINNGGLTGVGLGKSTQKYSYIPEPHTDMVFAIIAEENGVLICSLIFIAYIIILYRILKLSMKTKKISNKYICIGVATYIFLHIFINLGGLFGVIPLTGVPLPFLSYGGSFTISLIASLGIIERIHIETKNEKIKVR